MPCGLLNKSAFDFLGYKTFNYFPSLTGLPFEISPKSMKSIFKSTGSLFPGLLASYVGRIGFGALETSLVYQNLWRISFVPYSDPVAISIIPALTDWFTSLSHWSYHSNHLKRNLKKKTKRLVPIKINVKPSRWFGD